MDQKQLLEMEQCRYNPWGHKRPLVCADTERWTIAQQKAKSPDLSASEQSAVYARELTGCGGFEFVGFSNARLVDAVHLSSGVVLFPCFAREGETIPEGDPILRYTIRMQKKGRFVYDGWVPITAWDAVSIRNAVQSVSEALSAFSVRGCYFEWEPKYRALTSPKPFFFWGHHQLLELERLCRRIDDLAQVDRSAIYRSLAWLSQSVRSVDVVGRFFYAILTIESLAIYIEERAEEASPFWILRTTKITDLERKKCIDNTLSKWLDSDPAEAIKRAYFDCVISLTNTLKSHLKLVLPADSAFFELLFQKNTSGKSLYDLRHDIAHGRSNLLNEVDRDLIRQSADEAEKVATNYIRLVFEKALNAWPTRSGVSSGIPIDFHEMVLTSERMYHGATLLAELYS
ncbi:MAG: hypothetical protein AB1664_06620 [Thermodesulfobacteriota bacterium]